MNKKESREQNLLLELYLGIPNNRIKWAMQLMNTSQILKLFYDTLTPVYTRQAKDITVALVVT